MAASLFLIARNTTCLRHFPPRPHRRHRQGKTWVDPTFELAAICFRQFPSKPLRQQAPPTPWELQAVRQLALQPEPHAGIALETMHMPVLIILQRWDPLPPLIDTTGRNAVDITQDVCTFTR